LQDLLASSQEEIEEFVHDFKPGARKRLLRLLAEEREEKENLKHKERVVDSPAQPAAQQTSTAITVALPPGKKWHCFFSHSTCPLLFFLLS
jgi:hypothetical protein